MESLSAGSVPKMVDAFARNINENVVLDKTDILPLV